MVGSGAWACAAMHIVAQNCAAFDVADEFVDDVRMWVYEEEWEVRRLTPLSPHLWGKRERGLLALRLIDQRGALGNRISADLDLLCMHLTGQHMQCCKNEAKVLAGPPRAAGITSAGRGGLQGRRTLAASCPTVTCALPGPCRAPS